MMSLKIAYRDPKMCCLAFPVKTHPVVWLMGGCRVAARGLRHGL